MAEQSRRSEAAPTRRGVLASGLAAGVGWAAGAGRAVAAPETPAPLPRRALGRTGVEVSVFGLGCFYLGGAASDAEGAEILQRAVELGCTYVDTAPSYYAGVSERRVGRGLVGRRDRVFLATKTLLRAPKEARRELEASLTRMGTDHVDLIQVHCVRDEKDCALVLSDAGPLPELVRAKEKGLTRFIGVTGHEDPAVMKTCIEGYPWDTVLMPFNPTDPHWKSFLEGALPTAVARGLGRIGMKVFGGGRLVQGEGGLAPEDCLRFAYGLDVATAIVGCATTAQVETAARIAAEARPLPEERRRELIAQAARFSGKGEKGVEWYKRP